MRNRAFWKSVCVVALTGLSVVSSFAEEIRASNSAWAYHRLPMPHLMMTLGVWGDGSTNIESEQGNYPTKDNFSYGFIRWDLPKSCSLIKSAKLVLFVTEENFKTEKVSEFPVIVRGLQSDFSAKEWSKSQKPRIDMTEAGLLGTGTTYNKAEKKFEIELDVKNLGGLNVDYLAIAITSKIQGTQKQENYYPFHSAMTKEKNNRPLLVVEFEN